MPALLKPFGIGPIILRGIIWVVAVLILAYGVSEGHKRTQIKAEAGWFFLFFIIVSALVYLIFGFLPIF